MKITSKHLLFTVILAVLLNIPNINAQSETEKIDKLISQKREYNKSNKTSIVYKIQLYNGNETEAYKVKQNFDATYTFPKYNTKVIYSAPEWKTQIMNFKTRLEADSILKIVSEKFAGAFVLEDKI